VESQKERTAGGELDGTVYCGGLRERAEGDRDDGRVVRATDGTTVRMIT